MLGSKRGVLGERSSTQNRCFYMQNQCLYMQNQYLYMQNQWFCKGIHILSCKLLLISYLHTTGFGGKSAPKSMKNSYLLRQNPYSSFLVHHSSLNPTAEVFNTSTSVASLLPLLLLFLLPLFTSET